MTNPLQTKAMLVQLSISQWTGRKADKKVTSEVEQVHGAHDSGKFNKILVAKELLDPIAKIAGRARDYHYHLTLAWSDSGPRILPSALFAEYTTTFRGLKAEFEKAVNTMVASYPVEVQAARNRLGTMYEPDDYPDPGDMYMKFNLKTEFMPVPDGDDFRVSVGEDDRQLLADSVRESVNTRLAAAVTATYSRIRDVVSKIEERLSVPGAIFRDSLITNAIELCQVLDGLNITDDPVITDICKDIRDHLLMPPSLVRTNSSTRQATAEQATRILAKLP
jgi:hypothetical protein